MKIGFDARMILHSGIGTYTRGILKILTQRKNLDFTIFGDISKIADYPARKVLADFPIYSIREQVFFPKILSKNPVDLLHVPHYNAPLGFNGNLVVTIHDLIHLKFPKSRISYLYARGMFEAVLRRAKGVIADSEQTKKDILKMIGIPEKKIRVIYPGIDEDFTPVPSQTLHPDEWTKDPYILHVGNLKPTKNIRTLVDAFILAREKIPELKMLLAGKDFMPEYTKQIAREKGIRLVGEVNRIKLVQMYQRARLFVFPSLYEGFGLPPLEAMACGTPVIVSRAASLPEVVGNAAMIFDPLAVTQLADMIFGLWKDDRKRKELSAKGLDRAMRFTWWKCADQIEQVYRECF